MFRVVKLGGGLLGDPMLTRWLRAVAKAGGRVVVVPGGGPFADAVRQAQGTLDFDDSAAHRMALLAMAQYGIALCGLEPGLRPAATPRDIAETLARGVTPVWLPGAMAPGAPDVPEDWTVTSDSLAAWLASRLGARALALVKRGTTGGAYQPEHHAPLLDAAFPRFAAAFPGAIHLLGHDTPGALEGWLADKR